MRTTKTCNKLNVGMETEFFFGVFSECRAAEMKQFSLLCLGTEKHAVKDLMFALCVCKEGKPMKIQIGLWFRVGRSWCHLLTAAITAEGILFLTQ